MCAGQAGLAAFADRHAEHVKTPRPAIWSRALMWCATARMSSAFGIVRQPAHRRFDFHRRMIESANILRVFSASARVNGLLDCGLGTYPDSLHNGPASGTRGTGSSEPQTLSRRGGAGGACGDASIFVRRYFLFSRALYAQQEAHLHPRRLYE